MAVFDYCHNLGGTAEISSSFNLKGDDLVSA